MYQPWEIDVEVFPNFSRFYGNGNHEIINKLNRYFLAYYNLMIRNKKLQLKHYTNPSNKELRDKYCAGVIFEYRSRQRLMKLVNGLFPDYVLAAISKMLEQHEFVWPDGRIDTFIFDIEKGEYVSQQKPAP